jgi:hypothetical protein
VTAEFAPVCRGNCQTQGIREPSRSRKKKWSDIAANPVASVSQCETPAVANSSTPAILGLSSSANSLQPALIHSENLNAEGCFKTLVQDFVPLTAYIDSEPRFRHSGLFCCIFNQLIMLGKHICLYTDAQLIAVIKMQREQFAFVCIHLMLRQAVTKYNCSVLFIPWFIEGYTLRTETSINHI